MGVPPLPKVGLRICWKSERPFARSAGLFKRQHVVNLKFKAQEFDLPLWTAACLAQQGLVFSKHAGKSNGISSTHFLAKFDDSA